MLLSEINENFRKGCRLSCPTLSAVAIILRHVTLTERHDESNPVVKVILAVQVPVFFSCDFMEITLDADDNMVFTAFSLIIFIVLAALSTQKSGLGSAGQHAHSTEAPPVTLDKLPMDTAILSVDVDVLHQLPELNFSLLGISTNCHKCPPQILKEGVRSEAKFNITVETSYHFNLTLKNSHGKVVCRNDLYLFGEHGLYRYIIHNIKRNITCKIKNAVKPDDAYMPLLYAFLCIMGLAIFIPVLLYFLREYNFLVNWKLFEDTQSLMNADLGTPNFSGSVDDRAHNRDEMTEKPKKQRLKSLDTFRGIALTIMIFVNYGGGGYYFFKHARWDGLTVADLVFPWFMWIMGISIVISFRSLRNRQVRPIKIFLKIVRRTVILFALGLLVSNYNALAKYRVPGVLQRFAACYFIVAMLQLVINPGTDSVLPVGAWWNPLRDVVALWGQWLFMLSILAIYIIVTFALEAPGCPRGYIGPGGLADNESYINCTGGIAGYIDRHLVFGPKHIYQSPTCMKTYKTKVPYDPEGALGTLSSSFLVFLGVQAGYTLFTFPNHIARTKRWIIWSLLLGCITLALTGTSNEGVIPLNKNLWSVSFIFATGGMAFVLLTLCYLLVDVLGWWSGAPFIFPGMNSIVVYVGSEILNNHFPFSWKVVKSQVQHGELLAMNLVGTTLWIIISYYLYHIQFFVKI
ncbi:heparan-alpha-glucosaminide N-acetyltransferase-like isoform X2 [Montipora capricornis]|uniref:heparan-alpha-glucosaminide N-acetyltransferase-like isoform X2 n=1 Tax=Montipora capricornis TaxID=246305 RepID=UPI0035F16B57